MAKIADADKMRAGKLDSAWVKAVCVGRVDKSNEHLLLTTNGCIRSRVVRRIPDGNRRVTTLKFKDCRGDTFKGSAEMLKTATVRPSEPPRPSRGLPRKDRVSSASEDNDDDDDEDSRTRSNSRRSHARQFG